MDLSEILQLIDAVSSKEHMSSLELAEGSFRLIIRTDKDKTAPFVQRGTAGECMAAEPESAKEEGDGGTKAQSAPGQKEPRQGGAVMKSPLIGTFYAAPAEGAEPFVSVGAAVKKGQVLAIVEAMKLMNEIESEYDGTVEEIFAENGQFVEYGQPLFRIAEIKQNGVEYAWDKRN